MKFFLSLLFFVWFIVISCTKKQEHKIEHKKINPVERIAFQLQNKAEKEWNANNFHSAYYYYDKAKSFYQTLNKNENIVYCLIQMASIQQLEGDYFGSESSLIEALPYIKKNKTYQAAIHNLLGIASKEQKNYNSAIEHYNMTFNLAENKLTQIVSLNNIANVYIQQKKFDKAQTILNRILKEKGLDSLPFRKAIYLDNLGYSLYNLNQKEEGLKLLKKALQTKLQSNNTYERVESYLHLADVYIKLNPQKSFYYATKAYQNATLHKSIDQRLKALLLIIKLPQSTQKQALQYANLQDSITQIRSTAKNQFAKIRYDARVAKEENLKLKNEKIATDLKLQKSQNEKNIWISASALLATLIFFIYNYLKNKTQLEKQKATYFTETKIAKKIHDEIANDVFQTMSFVETQKIEKPENREILISLLDTLYQRSRNISKENESIETGIFFFESILQMINGYKSNTQNIIIKKEDTIDWESLSEIKKITLFRVLQELLVNMKKHSQATIVVVCFSTHKKALKIDYSDNGKGFNIESIKKSGLANVENRIININGTITFDATDKGLKVKINIPK
ncbi:tetratricopeptide repeat-containing sensor histidine kinase [Flavobacterium columnare]|uniref:tetratricopeptide repeat-containing sensor histidine kinase n=1 Tax=Flavobacterium columnare TaxID=996 RepID=UPI004034F458